MKKITAISLMAVSSVVYLLFSGIHLDYIKPAFLEWRLTKIPQVTCYDARAALAMPLQICPREAPISHEIEVEMARKYGSCPLLDDPPESTSILLIQGNETYGRFGNNMIEIMHAFLYARENGVIVAIRRYSWAAHGITEMWMAVQGDDIDTWRHFVERSLCVLIVEANDDLGRYKHVKVMDSYDGGRELYVYKYHGAEPLSDRVEYMGHILRTLYRSYNDGTGHIMHRDDQIMAPAGDSCSVLNVAFGTDGPPARYSVVHSRSLEGAPGLHHLGLISKRSGCDPTAALEMTPEYIKAILGPLGMLHHPILFITDNQRPEILERLLADPEIGPNIRLIPPEASWIGGDIVAALVADVFVGNPASSFSTFIAKSRMALGYDASFMFRKKDEDGNWVDVCDDMCIYNWKKVRAGGV